MEQSEMWYAMLKRPFSRSEKQMKKMFTTITTSNASCDHAMLKLPFSRSEKQNEKTYITTSSAGCDHAKLILPFSRSENKFLIVYPPTYRI